MDGAALRHVADELETLGKLVLPWSGDLPGGSKLVKTLSARTSIHECCTCRGTWAGRHCDRCKQKLANDTGNFWETPTLKRTRLCYTARATRYNELHGSCNSLHSSLHECRYMAQKTLVRKNGLVRPLVTASSNGVVRKLVTRCLSELIKTSVGNKLQAQIAAFPHPCLCHCPTSCSHCLCFPM